MIGPPALNSHKNKGWRKAGDLSATLCLPATRNSMIGLIVPRNHASCRMQEGTNACQTASS